jgi:CheY-like chemotaxis protein
VELCKSVLVVEDDEDVRDCILQVLNGEGYDAQVAENGKEGLEKLQSMPVPTLVLLDLMMPSMNGWEFLDAQKSDPKLHGHKIVTISAIKPNASIEDSKPLKTDGEIKKPIHLELLWEKVTEFCGTSRTTART